MRNIILFIFLLFSSTLFSQQTEIMVSDINIQGNKITKSRVILQELALKKGNLINKSEIENSIKESEENLKNLNLFNFSEITYRIEENKLFLIVKLQERWYIWPYPIFEISERNFNVWWTDFKESNYSDLRKLNYGVFFNWENFRGKNELLVVKFRRGYKEHYQLNYDIPYLNKSKTLGINTDLNYFRRKETFYNTSNNHLQYFIDDKKYSSKEIIAFSELIYRQDSRKKHKVKLGYHSSEITDSLSKLNPNYLNNNSTFGDYFLISYEMENEQRDDIDYPLNGHYFNFILSKHIKNKANVNHWGVMGKAEKHIQLSDRIYLGSSFLAKITSDSYHPYFMQQALGFENYVRSYEYYVIDGQQFWISKTSLKYKLVDKTDFDISYFKMDQFKKSHYSLYFSIFSDMGYVKDNQNSAINPLANQLLWGKGISIDYVTYYDKLLRIEYSVNRLGEKGIFLHFSNPF